MKLMIELKVQEYLLMLIIYTEFSNLSFWPQRL